MKSDEKPISTLNPETGVKHPDILKKFPKTPIKSNLMLLLGTLIVVLGGIATGWFMSSLNKPKGSTVSEGNAEAVKQSDTEAGVMDESSFTEKESPEGLLKEGGIKGEGEFHLERTGGDSQNVYLTSTVIDLKPFVGKKVKIWGESLSGVYAGWLMDVGKVKVIE